MGFFDFLKKQGMESAIVRAARASGGNVSGYVVCVNLLDDALTAAAAASGIRFRPGARERIRAALRAEISAEGTDQVVLNQTLRTIMTEMFQQGNPVPSMPSAFTPSPAIPPGYQLVPLATQVASPPPPAMVWEEETKEEQGPEKKSKKAKKV